MRTDILHATPLVGWPQPGTVVTVPLGFGFRHLGIVSDRWLAGQPMVIAGSSRTGTVAEEAWGVFCPDGRYEVVDLGGPINGHAAVWRARSHIGTRYSLLNWNCDHVVRDAVGLQPESPQIVACVLGGLMIAAFMAAK